MQRILAWDTSSKTGSVAALIREGKAPPRVVAEWTLGMEASHAERLLWAIDEVLRGAGSWKLEELDAFGVGLGPGSFTGLRIGLTAARTLAAVSGVPLVGVSSLAALARPVARVLLAAGLGSSRVVAVTDACKGEVYALWGAASAVCRSSGAPFPSGVREEVLPLESLRKVLGKTGGRASVAIGDATERYPSVTGAGVQARWVGVLAFERLEAGLESRDPLEVVPRYLRVPDAERKLKAGLLPVRPEWGSAAPGAPVVSTRASMAGKKRRKG